ncbi:dimethyl sulfoxide reductase anchor subunit [Brachyspira pilosicoli]|uniref:Glycosyltransferase n=1 Tax=Brachyspira pilosicoli TaxID=52584 RepID=A0A5C8ERE5_BRAPL|nr:dimethyl sulfoxide reductase anchor subunit [Brachyspira pilosicoli]TXJ40435.1 hypothetical protein EPJ72_08350 [Brachyspira pilosicoli]
MKDKNYASFIITKIDNKENYQRLENYILNKFEYSEIIILINDSNVKDIKEYLSPISNNVLCLNLGNNIDENNSIRAGLEFSKGDIVFVIKDLSINKLEDYLDNLYESNKKGIDSSFLTSKYYRLKDKLTISLISIFLKHKLKNVYDIIFLVTRRVINAITEDNSKTTPISYIIRDIGYNYNEFECNIRDKKYYMSKQTRSVYLLLFSEASSNFAASLSLLSAIIAIVTGIYALIIYLSNKPVEGWTTTFLFLSFSFTMIFAIFSIIIRYLSVIQKELYNKPNFRVKSVSKL